MKHLVAICIFAMATTACTSSSDDADYVKGFNPPPVADGYTRYVLPVYHGLLPGENKMLCQWVAVANDADLDVVDIKGYQSVTGHHAVLYSTSETEDIGTTRECTTQDMVSVEFLGGVGGEAGGGAPKLPDPYVFRFGKQRMLLANAHYLNATDSVQDVQSVLDIKTAEPSDAHKPAGMVNATYTDFQIPANTPSYSLDTYATVPVDMTLLVWFNHMHSNGTSALTEVKRADGMVQTLAVDTVWNAEEAFNPSFTHYDPSASTPMQLKAGDQLHINCTWENNTSSPIMFPDEMCVGSGFYTESSKQYIIDANPM